MNNHDGETFFTELARYLQEDKPIEKLEELRHLTERYRTALLDNFSIEDLLSEIDKVRRYEKESQ